jgi:hypothetical protein
MQGTEGPGPEKDQSPVKTVKVMSCNL